MFVHLRVRKLDTCERNFARPPTTNSVLSYSVVLQAESDLVDHLVCFSAALQAKTPIAALIGWNLGTCGPASNYISVSNAPSIFSISNLKAISNYYINKFPEEEE